MITECGVGSCRFSFGRGPQALALVHYTTRAPPRPRSRANYPTLARPKPQSRNHKRTHIKLNAMHTARSGNIWTVKGAPRKHVARMLGKSGGGTSICQQQMQTH
eukprot:9255280-Pyramimonas_sp.AAC.2